MQRRWKNRTKQNKRQKPNWLDWYDNIKSMLHWRIGTCSLNSVFDEKFTQFFFWFALFCSWPAKSFVTFDTMNQLNNWIFQWKIGFISLLEPITYTESCCLKMLQWYSQLIFDRKCLFRGFYFFISFHWIWKCSRRLVWASISNKLCLPSNSMAQCDPH